MKNHLTAVVENFTTDSDAKFIWVNICSFYRPPNCEVEPLLSLSESLKATAEKEANYPIVILGGDNNLPHTSWDNGCGQSGPTYGLITLCWIWSMIFT